MALMMGALYEALSDAGASHEQARKAAEEVAAYDNRIASVEAKLDRLDAKVDAKFSQLTWMNGVTIGLVLIVLGRTFFQ